MSNMKAEQRNVADIFLKDGGINKILFDALPAFCVAIGTDRKIMAMNDAMLQAFGYTEDEVAGRDYLETFVPEEDRARLSEVFEELITSLKDTVNENRVVTKDGRELIVEWHGRPIFNEAGELEFFFGIGVDISERKKSEGTIHAGEERYRTILETIEEGYFEVDLSGVLTFFNRSLAVDLGYGEDELMGMQYQQIMDDENAQKVYRAFIDVYRSGVPKKYFDLRLTRSDGREIFVELSVAVITDSEGAPAGFRGIVRDMSERRELETLYQMLANTSRAGVYIVQDKKFQFINYNAARYAEYTEREMLGMDSLHIVHPEDRAIVIENAKKMLLGETNLPYEFRVITKTGNIRWILETVTSMEYRGRPAVLGNSLDVTELREARRRLEESEQRLSQIIEGNPVPTFVIDRNHRITHWNRACENLTGVPATEVIGTLKQWTAFYSSERLVMADFIVDSAEQEEILKSYGGRCRKSTMVEGAYESENFFPDLGESGKWLFVTSAPVKDMAGIVIGAIETLQDFTDRREGEDILRESEKKYQELSITDNLTKLYNRRHLYEQLNTEIDRSRRYDHPLSIMVLDVDDFKRYNDKFGHLAGDEVLVRLAGVIRNNIRKCDSAYRYGGEEFVVVLPETSGQRGVVAGERIREEFRKETFSPNEGDKVYVTLSIGVSELKPHEEMNDLIARADDRMYTAKREGKDRVIFF